MIYQIILAPLAIADLEELQRWIAEAADSRTAMDYVARIKSKIIALDHFPNRGTPRDDLGLGIRTLSFERRIKIAYRVIDGKVRIERVVSNWRALDQIM